MLTLPRALTRPSFLIMLAVTVALELVAIVLTGHGVAWAAVGTGAVYLKNLPAPGTFTIDAVTFARETSRNRKTNPANVIPGWGQACNETIDATGIVGRIKLTVNLQITNDGSAAPTPTSQWPWNFIKQLTVAANGINALFSCDGIELRALQRIRNPYFIDRESSFAIGAGVSDVSNITLIYEIPLAFDDESLMGAVFAQTQDTTLNWKAQAANPTDLFSAHAPTMTQATVTSRTEFYSIPYYDTQQGRVAIIPDLRRMHGFTSFTNPLATTTYSPLQRVSGVLCRVLQRGNNAANAAGDVNWSTLCTQHEFNYGSNVTPYSVTGQDARAENNQDYGDQMLQAADSPNGVGPVRYVVDDLVRDNALRDVVHLLGVTQPQFINVFSGLSVSNGNNSVIQTAQEHMVAGN